MEIQNLRTHISDWNTHAKNTLKAQKPRTKRSDWDLNLCPRNGVCSSNQLTGFYTITDILWHLCLKLYMLLYVNIIFIEKKQWGSEKPDLTVVQNFVYFVGSAIFNSFIYLFILNKQLQKKNVLPIYLFRLSLLTVGGFKTCKIILFLSLYVFLHLFIIGIFFSGKHLSFMYPLRFCFITFSVLYWHIQSLHSLFNELNFFWDRYASVGNWQKWVWWFTVVISFLVEINSF